MDYRDEGEVRTDPLRVAMRRRWPLVVVLCVIGAVVGIVLGGQRQQDYTAQASILIVPLDGNPFSASGSGDDLVNLQTEAQLVKSDAVAELVRKDLGSAVPLKVLRDGLAVSVPPNTQVLTVAYTSADRSIALARAQSFAESYLDYRHTRAESMIKSQAASIDDRIAKREVALKPVVEKLTTVKAGSPSARLLKEKISSLSTQINQLQARAAELQIGSTDPGQVIAAASIPSPGLLSPRLIFGVLGLVVGLIAGVATVLMSLRGGYRIRDATEVDAAGPPVLARIPMRACQQFRGSPSAASIPEGFRVLRTRILTAMAERPWTILLTSATRHEGPPRSAVGLATTFARANFEVVLVNATSDADGVFEPEGEEDGLFNVLAEDKPLDSVLVSVAPHLQVLPSGRPPSDAADLLMSPQMAELMEDLRKRADIVLVVGSPTLAPRFRALGGGGGMLVVEVVKGVTRRRQLPGQSASVVDPAEAGVEVLFVDRKKFARREVPATTSEE